MKLQRRLIEEADSTSAEKTAHDVAHIEKICSILKSGKDSIAITDQLKSYLKSTISVWGADLLKSGMNPEEAINAQINIFNSPWFRYFVTYNPRPALKKVKCPVLAMNGALDLQVPPKENLKEIEKALRAGGNKNITIKLMFGLNHLFQNARPGSPKEYAQIEETFSPATLKVMGDWIVENTDRK